MGVLVSQEVGRTVLVIVHLGSLNNMLMAGLHPRVFNFIAWGGTLALDQLVPGCQCAARIEDF